MKEIYLNTQKTLKKTVAFLQKSVLDLLFFLIYINDLNSCIEFGKIVMFTDGTS